MGTAWGARNAAGAAHYTLLGRKGVTVHAHLPMLVDYYECYYDDHHYYY